MAAKPSGMAVPSALCLAALAALLVLLLPRGFVLGGQRLDLPVELALAAGAVLAGSWGAFSAREGRILLGSVLAAALLSPAYDPRAPAERWPLYLAMGALFLLHVEFALLHAKMTRLARLPRAHVTQVGKARELELHATANRIAESWPTPLATAAGLVLLMLGLQLLLAALAPRALGESLELRGPFGLALAGMTLLALLAALAVRRRGAQPSPGPSPAPSPGSAAGPSAAPPAAPPGPGGGGP
jgi:hypothetical protein